MRFYDIVETHAQIDNRLFLANFTYGKYDYALLQRAANTIGIEWVTKPVRIVTGKQIGRAHV